jgi:hypothetical protein
MQHCIGEVAGCELTALVGVNYLRQTETHKRFFDDFNRMTGLQRDRHFVGQHPPTGDIDNGGEVDKAACHGNVRGVQCPDLIGPHDGKLAQQLRIDLFTRHGLAGAGLVCQCFNPHATHQRANMTPTNLSVLSGQWVAQHARTHERMRQVQLVDAAHGCQVCGTDWLGHVVHRASADLEQFCLPGNGQLVVSVNSLALRSAVPLW